ncbi:hypothetical protein PFISCL1PPCAC_18801, partial [Pristionchus fissidentatus]
LQYDSITQFAKTTLFRLRKPVTNEGSSPSWFLLTIFVSISALFFFILFESWIVTIFTSMEIRGYQITYFKQLLDLMEFSGWTAFTFPAFRLFVYCRDDECDRFRSLKSRQVEIVDNDPDDLSIYRGVVREQPYTSVGFTSVGEELLEANGIFEDDVYMFDRKYSQLFSTDSRIGKYPFSFLVNDRRKDLREPIARSIAWTFPIYGRVMTRYLSPYPSYSRQERSESFHAVQPLGLPHLGQV